MKVMVTGSSGKLGTAICKQLAGVDIVHCSRSCGLDIRSKDLPDALTGVDWVIHAAALKKGASVVDLVETNVNGTLNLLRSCLKAKVGFVRVISSIEAITPDTTYGMSKYLAEQIAIDFSGDLCVNVMRLPTIWGTEYNIVEGWRSLARQGEVLPVFIHNGLPKFKFATTLQGASYWAAELARRSTGTIYPPPVPIINTKTLAKAIIALEGSGSIKEVEVGPMFYYESLCDGYTSASAPALNFEETLELLKTYDR